VVEIMARDQAGTVKGMYVMGENPAMSTPMLEPCARVAGALDHLVVQDIFLTETAYLADVILPASRLPREDRHLHQHRPPGADRPPGARAAGRGPQDLWRHASTRRCAR
jgi:anaerobic selenocysteine-containing dehydrogenase